MKGACSSALHYGSLEKLTTTSRIAAVPRRGLLLLQQSCVKRCKKGAESVPQVIHGKHCNTASCLQGISLNILITQHCPQVKNEGKKIKVQVSSYFSRVVQILMLCHQVWEGEVQ